MRLYLIDSNSDIFYAIAFFVLDCILDFCYIKSTHLYIKFYYVIVIEDIHQLCMGAFLLAAIHFWWDASYVDHIHPKVNN